MSAAGPIVSASPVPIRFTERMPFAWRLWVLALVLGLPPLLYVVPIHKLAARLQNTGRARVAPVVNRLVWEVDRWQRWLPWPWRTTCLKRASVLFTLLRRAGIEVELHIGVKRDDAGAFAAHAWLVRDGQVYLEKGAGAVASYRLITRFPEPPAAASALTT